MKRFLVWMLVLAGAGTLMACGDDDDPSVKVPSAVRSSFEQMYPDATGVEWKGRKPYVMAEFRDGSQERQAWFDQEGKWYMTKTTIAYAALPEAVRSAFESSAYADWRVDDVDQIVRNDLETIYVIDVESGSLEYELYYTADGVLLRAAADKDGSGEYEGLLPTDLPQAVKEFIDRQYPGARVVNAERENGELEVEIVDGRTPREVYFSSDGAWLRTKTEVTVAEVPAAVMQAVRDSQYGSWRIDGVDHYDSPVREWYLFELEDSHSGREVELSVLADGTIL